MKHYILLIPLFFAGYHPTEVSAANGSSALRNSLEQLEQRERELVNLLRREKQEARRMIQNIEKLKRDNALLERTIRNLQGNMQN